MRRVRSPTGTSAAKVAELAKEGGSGLAEGARAGVCEQHA